MKEVFRSSPIIVVLLDCHALHRGQEKRFTQLFTPYLKPGTRLLLDISHVYSADSVGVRVLLRLAKQVQSLEGELKLCGLSEPIRHLFQVLRIHHVIEIYNTAAEAERAFHLRAKGQRKLAGLTITQES